MYLTDNAPAMSLQSHVNSHTEHVRALPETEVEKFK